MITFKEYDNRTDQYVVDEIKKMDLMNLTPLQALEKLHEIQQKLL